LDTSANQTLWMRTEGLRVHGFREYMAIMGTLRMHFAVLLALELVGHMRIGRTHVNACKRWLSVIRYNISSMAWGPGNFLLPLLRGACSCWICQDSSSQWAWINFCLRVRK